MLQPIERTLTSYLPTLPINTTSHTPQSVRFVNPPLGVKYL